MLSPHLEFLPELHVSFFITFWDGHIVVLTFLLVQQLVPFRDRGKEGVSPTLAPPRFTPHPKALVQLFLKCIPRGDGTQVTS